MRCRSCGVKQINVFGLPTNIQDGMCRSCRDILSNTWRKAKT